MTEYPPKNLLTIKQKIKFQIIEYIDKLDKYCWSDLVGWALGGPWANVGLVGQCAEAKEYNYCGKCDSDPPEEGL